MNTSTQQRLPLPDLLKGIAVLLMIQVHIMELFALPELYAGPVGNASLFLGGIPAAPVFMVVMGYLVALRNKQPKALMTRGIQLFGAGMLLNIGMNAHLIFNVLFKGWGNSLNIYHYLFGVDILHLAGLSLVIIAVVLRMFKERIYLYILSIAVIFLLQALVPAYTGDSTLIQYVLAFLISQAGWSYFPLIPWLAYPLAGICFFLVEKKFNLASWSLPLKMVILTVLAAVLVFTGSYGTGITGQLTTYYHHDAIFFGWALVFMMAWAILAGIIHNHYESTRAMQFLRWLGKQVTPAYIIQWLFIGNIATAVYKTQSLYQVSGWFLLILIFTGLMTRLWTEIKRKYNLKILAL